MTLPPSLVAAVREAKGCRRGPALSGAACCGDCAEAIARSVLRAALTALSEQEPWCLGPFDTEAEARAVANALNLLSALEAP